MTNDNDNWRGGDGNENDFAGVGNDDNNGTLKGRGRGGGRGGRSGRGSGRGKGRASRRKRDTRNGNGQERGQEHDNDHENEHSDQLEGHVMNEDETLSINYHNQQHQHNSNDTHNHERSNGNGNGNDRFHETSSLQKQFEDTRIFDNSHEEEKKSDRMDNINCNISRPSPNRRQNSIIKKNTKSNSIIYSHEDIDHHHTNNTNHSNSNSNSLPPSKTIINTINHTNQLSVSSPSINQPLPLPLPPTSMPQETSLPRVPPRVDSTTSIISKASEKSTTEKDANAGSVGVIDLLKHKRDEKPSTSTTTTTKNKKKKGKKNKHDKNKNHNNNNNNNDHHSQQISEQRQARNFNTSVRHKVERSDPDGLHELLHDKKTHKYALQADVLETVMKAFVVAAMFEEALYCLRNCTLPGTLSVLQTERILQCLPQNLRTSSAYAAADMIDALCIATEFEEVTHRTYFLRIARGIALEFLEEATSARDRICSAPCERLVRSAVCVVEARLRRGKKATELVVVPGHQLGVFVPDTAENRGMQAGDAVGVLPYAGPYPMSAESLDRNMIEATVTGTQPLVVRLQDKSNASLYAMLTDHAEGNVYRVDKLANRMGFNRQLAAAVALASPTEKDLNGVKIHNTKSDLRRPSPELIKAITAMDETIDRVMMLGGGSGGTTKGGGTANSSKRQRGELTSTAALCAQPVPWNSCDEQQSDDEYHYDYQPSIIDGQQPPNINNDSITTDHHRRPPRQRSHRTNENRDDDAVRDASRLALEKYGAFENLNPSQQLAVEGAATNRLTLVQGPPGTGKTAVAIRIIQHWARVSSGTNGEQQKPILATSDSNIAVDNLVEGCANVGLRVVRLGRPEAIRPELLRYCIDRPQGGGSNNNGANGNNNNGYKNYNNNGGNQGYGPSAFKEKMKVLKNAQVVCCTCIGSGADILDNMTFERVLVDEATQATEPAVLVPLARMCRQLVLVGDHCQLPPTVLSTRAEEEGLGVPLFSRMVACGVPPFMLDTQYRMHPGIAMFPSDLFYGGKLLNGVSPPERRPLAGFPWPREEFPVAFVPVPHGQEVDDGVSKKNEEEANAACDAVAALLAGGQCTPLDIAVVTPYAAQVRLIRRLTRKLLPSPPYVEVSSTDGFQGREKEAVVFSAVRSNDYGQVGFVSDWRRVNVSFTRARRGLIVIGNDVTLRRGDPDTWMPWLAWADAHGINMDKPGVPRGRYDAEQLRRVRGGTTAAEMLKDVLERQKKQRVSAERELMKAEKKSSGHIIGGGLDVTTVGGGGVGVGGLNNVNGVNNNMGGVMGGVEGMNGPHDGSSQMGVANNLKQNLAELANTDGCWDDSDDEEQCGEVHHSTSMATFTTMDSSNLKGDDDEPQDAWDL